jgi:hypothetical protein
MELPLCQLFSGIVTENLSRVLESAGPADAAEAFIISVPSPEILFFKKWAPTPAGGLA